MGDEFARTIYNYVNMATCEAEYVYGDTHIE